MQPDTGKYLGHILDSINEIENCMSDVQKYVDFDKNKMLVRAVERNLKLLVKPLTGLNKATLL